MVVHTDPDTADMVAAVRFTELMDGYLGTQLLYVGVERALLAQADLRLTTVVAADPVSGVHVFEAHPV